jgi:spore maturation protein CgeB
MALNISRGAYQELYSSDRISSLIGNGLLVFINKNTKLNKLFSKKEVIFYFSLKDLLNKIKYYASNDKIRIKYAKSAYNKYHNHMNNKIISNYILNCVGLIKDKKPFWHNKI